MASIVERNLKGGTSYSIAYRIPNPDNKDKKTQKWLKCKNEKEAEYLLPEVEEAEKAGLEYIRPGKSHAHPRPPAPANSFNAEGDLTVTEMLEEYVEMKCAEGWGARTLNASNGLINNYIKNTIGELRVSSLTPKLMQNFYNDLPNHTAVTGNHKNAEPKPISKRTVLDINKILKPAFDLAVVNGYIENNPTRSVRKPKIPENPRDRWSKDEVVEAHVLALEEDDDFNVSLYMELMYECTARSGEVSALTEDCIDVSEESIAKNEASILINKTLGRFDIESIKKTKERDMIYIFPNLKAGSKGTIALKEPKTEKGKRRIYISTTLARALIKHIKEQEQRIIAVGDDYTDYGFRFVFTQLNGRPYEVKSLSKKFKQFVLKKGLREVDAYSLRHSSATDKLSGSNDIKAVQAMGGWADADMLLRIYANSTKEGQKNIALQMERILHNEADSSNESASNKSDDT